MPAPAVPSEAGTAASTDVIKPGPSGIEDVEHAP